MLTGKYRDFFRRIKTTIPADRLVTDPLRTIAYGSDASFYRLIPQIVINVENETEVQRILREATVIDTLGGAIVHPTPYVAEGTYEEVSANPQVLEAYVGSDNMNDAHH